MAVLIYSVDCIHGGNALIFRTLCPWLYEVLSMKKLDKAQCFLREDAKIKTRKSHRKYFR